MYKRAQYHTLSNRLKEPRRFIQVLNGPRQVVAIEVKSGLRRKARGIEAFAQKYQPHKTLMVGSEGLPWQQFLGIDPAELF